MTGREATRTACGQSPCWPVHGSGTYRWLVPGDTVRLEVAHLW